MNLQGLLDATGQGYSLEQAIAVNDQGQIAATALYQGQSRAVPLNPFPEQASLATFAALGGLAFLRRKRGGPEPGVCQSLGTQVRSTLL